MASTATRSALPTKAVPAASAAAQPGGGQLRRERRAMGLRIRLVEPRPAGHNVYDRALLPRLGLPLMAKMLAESGHDVRIYCEILAPVDFDDLLGADLVGIS